MSHRGYDAWKTDIPEGHECAEYECQICHDRDHATNGASLKEMEFACAYCAEILKQKIEDGEYQERKAV